MRALIPLVAFFFSTQASVFAQYRTKGLALSLRAQATSWKLDDLDGHSFDSHRGGGTGAEVYYGMSRYFGLFGRIDLSSMSPDEGDSYTLTHLDIGVRALPMLVSRRVRPYAELAFAARSAEFNVGAQSLEASGPGTTVGAGCLIFVAFRLAAGVGVEGTFGNLDELTLGGFTLDTSIGATSWRGGLNLVWFP